ncbi:MAG: ATP-dependent RecD-like DNA helicase [Lachnospiraceae bacterium]|nr:ATP-dependent RecD-like DNA helicase [Lachnospiraceae bacterium]
MTIKGIVDQIIYRNEDNGYTVLALSIVGSEPCAGVPASESLPGFGEDEDEITCTGSMRDVSEGETLECTGEESIHPVYGLQFRVASFKVIPPDDIEGIIRYLGSGAVKGVGEVMARRIVKKFGMDSLRVIEEEPEKLSAIEGIGPKKARAIGVQVAEKRALRESVMLLQKFGISGKTASKLMDHYGNELRNVLMTDPWRMAGEVEGIGFRTADSLAVRSGVRMDSVSRLRSGLLFVLTESLMSGHCLMSRDRLLDRALELLTEGQDGLIDMEMLSRALDDLTIDGRIILKGTGTDARVWLRYVRMAELECAAGLRKLSDSADSLTLPEAFDDKDMERLDEEQRKAVKSVLEKGVTVITGGPGTGKTTVIRTVISALNFMGLKTSLAAPTGRAAKRMEQASGVQASTIHRLLEVQADGKEDDLRESLPRFMRNAENPLEANCVIVDEAGMIDIFLLRDLLRAISPGTRLVICGDRDQLPSVGPGQVLRDIISSGAVPVISLTNIHRQGEGSGIVKAAFNINKGLMPDLTNKGRDFFFLPRDDYRAIYKHMVLMITEKLPPYLGVRPSDIQVLTPMKKGTFGSKELSAMLQKILNPPSRGKAELKREEDVLRVGDRVMQTRNDYSLEWNVYGKYGVVIDRGTGIFNGDTGIISDIDLKEGRVTVVFEEGGAPGRVVDYDTSELKDLELSYAMTVHKSQGSEYPAVIMPVMPGPAPLMSRNLLYTAVTRAERMVVLMGDVNTLRRMTENADPALRMTGLSEALSSGGMP